MHKYVYTVSLVSMFSDLLIHTQETVGNLGLWLDTILPSFQEWIISYESKNSDSSFNPSELCSNLSLTLRCKKWSHHIGTQFGSAAVFSLWLQQKWKSSFTLIMLKNDSYRIVANIGTITEYDIVILNFLFWIEIVTQHPFPFWRLCGTQLLAL